MKSETKTATFGRHARLLHSSGEESADRADGTHRGGFHH